MTPRKYYANNLQLAPDELELASDGFARLLADSGHARQPTPRPQPGAGETQLDCTSEVVETIHTLRCCPETARISTALYEAAELRMWVILRELSRQSHQMYYNRESIRQALRHYSVPFSESNLSRWIHRGHKRYWNIDGNTKRIYPASPVLVAQRLLQQCIDFQLYELYTTNHPGQRNDMYIQVSGGNTRAFERHVYESWMASRNNPSISRWSLALLWNRTPVSLRAIEKGSQLEKLANFAFCDIEFSQYVPFDIEGNRRRDVHKVKVDGRYGWQWQISNTYFAPRIRQHDKRGVSRRVLYTIKREHPEIQATSASDAEAKSLGSLNRTHRMFYDNRKKARQNADKYGEAVRYVLLGRDDGNKALYQVSPDGGDYFEFWQCAATMLRRDENVHSSAMCGEIVKNPF